VRDARENLQWLGAEALGISPDTPEDLDAFDRKYELAFPLLSDPDHAVAEAWGTWREKTAYGKTSWGIVRSSFLVDEEGRIERIWYRVKPEETVPKAMEALEG